MTYYYKEIFYAFHSGCVLAFDSKTSRDKFVDEGNYGNDMICDRFALDKKSYIKYCPADPQKFKPKEEEIFYKVGDSFENESFALLETDDVLNKTEGLIGCLSHARYFRLVGQRYDV